MALIKLRIQNFRCHDEYSIEIGNGSTLIYGRNGSGKTSLIEAIYLALRGTSFRSSDRQIIKNSSTTTWFRVDLETDQNIRTVKFDQSKDSSPKTFEIDGYKKHRLSPAMKLPVVLFEPDDLRLLSGSPQRRREFIDKILAQIYPLFSSSLSRYNKALKQRNNLLKHEHITSSELSVWNLMLAEYGSQIVQSRLELIEKINLELTKTYNLISGANDQISIVYVGENLSKTSILRKLEQEIDRDKLLGYTGFGPHKHDFYFKFNNSDASQIASRGEVRSLILALKFIETDIVAKTSNYSPIILLDDVFSELDNKRQKMLTSHFSQYQTIITSTNKIDVENCKVIKIND